MGQNTEELTGNIDQTRRNLSQDVDELNDKVNPTRVMERRKVAARSRVGRLREKVMGSAEHARNRVPSPTDSAHGALGALEERTEGNPLAAGLVAFGAGMLLSSLLPASEAETRAAQRAVDAARDSGVVDEARSTGQDIGQDIGQHLKESAVDRTQDMRASAQDSAQTVKEEGRSSAQTVQEDAQQRS